MANYPLYEGYESPSPFLGFYQGQLPHQPQPKGKGKGKGKNQLQQFQDNGNGNGNGKGKNQLQQFQDNGNDKGKGKGKNQLQQFQNKGQPCQPYQPYQPYQSQNKGQSYQPRQFHGKGNDSDDWDRNPYQSQARLCASQLSRDGNRQECWKFFLLILRICLYKDLGLESPPNMHGCPFVHAEDEDVRMENIVQGNFDKSINEININFHKKMSSDEPCAHGSRCLGHMLHACSGTHSNEEVQEMQKSSQTTLREFATAMFRITQKKEAHPCRNSPFCQSFMQDQCAFMHTTDDIRQMETLCVNASHMIHTPFSRDPRDPSVRHIMSVILAARLQN